MARLSKRRDAWGIFFTLFVAYAWFHQGGGWNQNARFDQTRAVAEGGTWSIERFAYFEAGHGDLVRAAPPPELRIARGVPEPNTLDVSILGDRMFPNKPPGVTGLALPAQLLAGLLARSQSTAWKGLNASLWIVTVFSVGLLGALGGVLFLAVSRTLFPDVRAGCHTAAALALGLGTLWLPYSTMLFDHVPVAVLLLASFALLARRRSGRTAPVELAAAGFAAGLAVLCNYGAVLGAGLLAIYALTVRPLAPVLAFAGGALVPAALLGAYHAVCFGDPFALANAFQHDRFSSDELALGMLGWPDPAVARELLISPRFGLFLTSPVSLLALAGAVPLWRRRERRAEALLALAFPVAYLALNASFNGWRGGSSFGPRYLIPALPFFALPLALVFARAPRLAGAVAVASAAALLAVTAVSPQLKWSVVDVGRREVGVENPRWPADKLAPDRVSIHVIGAYEARPYAVFPRGSHEARWNAFNVGEVFAAGSWASVAPLAIFLGGAAWWLLRPRTRVTDPSTSGASG